MFDYPFISPRWRKVLADLWGNKLRTLLVVMSIAVGVFAVGMVYSSYLMFARDLDISWRSAAPASASLYADPFDQELVDSVRSLRGVKEAEGRRNVDLRVRTASGEWRQMYLTAIPDYSKQKVNIIKSQSGAWPPGDGDVLLERSSISELGLQQGESIEVETADGHKRRLKITGVVYDPSQIPSFFSGRCYGYINMDTLAKVDEERKLDQVNFVVEPWVLKGKETAPIEAVGRRAWSKLEEGDTTVFWLQANKPGEHQLQSLIDALVMLLTVLGVLSLLLGTFLLVNTVSAILTQQVRQIGIMKAIGARRGQILRLYLCLVGFYGVLALLIAAPLGALAASAVTGFIAQVFNFNSGGVELSPRVLLLEVTAAIVVPLFAAILPIWSGTGVTVREAVSDYGIGNLTGKSRLDKWIERIVERIKFLSRPVLLSLRNTFRRKGRLVLTLLTLTVAGTVFMAVFSVRASLYSTLDDALDYFHYDIAVGFTQNYRSARIDHEILRVPGVKAAESWGFTSGRVLKDERKESEDEASKNVFILAPPVTTRMIQPKIIKGRWLLSEDESALVVNTETLKDNPQLKVGNQAVLKIGHRRLKLTVVGIAKSTLTGPIVYAPYPWFTAAVQEAGGARSVQIVAQSDDPREQTELARKIEEHVKKNNLRVQNVDITWEQKQRIRSQFDILIVFLLIMAVLLAFVGALGLMGTMGINVLERTREIGIMRAIGASSLAIAKIFVVEALCIGVLSWLLGVMLALPIAALLSYQVGMMFLESPLAFSFSFLGVAIWLVLSALLSVAASLLPARNAAKLSVREVLGYE
ncbi:ABC transporter permease [Sporomusa acidovorans]|uniref:Macrolide export ATP-binding/permease protein MacB n=1 Tax=Sporomusa acidovorans (strain ATCC 49682 / DSM 3132 / Mol) TaxID=1123286 RepID=A0ABZ3J7U4_SPOA4|nr:FtsX-like permease family protein [Sporomusa acidovorans]OZC16741.1 ABC transporter permease YtrF precursor [Sporomusa acidovorans DSM 3132]SDE04064.1 putative ABC transport system permease protein [Sporomusa acidovorans]